MSWWPEIYFASLVLWNHKSSPKIILCSLAGSFAPSPRLAQAEALGALLTERQNYLTSLSLWTANNVPLANIDAVDALAASAVLVASMDHETISTSSTTGSQIRLHEGASRQ